jgi:integrase
MSASEPIRDVKDIIELLDYYRKQEKYRNCCFIALGFYTALKVSDLIQLRWRDVFDFMAGTFHTHISIEEIKTKRTKKVYLNEHLVNILSEYKNWLESNRDYAVAHQYLFKSRKGNNRPFTRQQAYRIIQEAAVNMGLGGVVSCESMRKTLGYNAEKLGISSDIIMDLYNHKGYEATKRYIGIDIWDDLEQEERDNAQKLISTQIMSITK